MAVAGSQTKTEALDARRQLAVLRRLANKGYHYVNPSKLGSGALAAFGIDQDGAPIKTPSGRIEVTPKTTAPFKNHDLLTQSGCIL